MIRIEGHRVWRGADKIGYVEGNHLYNEDGHKVGYWSGNELYDHSGKRLLRIEGNRIVSAEGSGTHLDDVIEDIPSATLPDIARVAIKTFFGD